jgi:endonuclease/exonuclease/phosphatase family metal-dependent hydrolase
MSAPPSSRPGYTVHRDGSVELVLNRPDAQSAQVAGDFTDWAPLPMQKREADGAWAFVTPPLAPGAHFYKYVIDGQWTTDPAHPMSEPDGFGGRNSVLGRDPPGSPLAAGLRIASLNLHTYQEPDPLLKLEQIAYALAPLDVSALALQEVGEHQWDSSRPNAGELLRRHLERLTERPWYHAWRMAHPGFHVYREGVSVLAVVPLQDVQEHRLSEGPFARNALVATLALPDATLRLCSTHVSWPAGGGEEEVPRLLQALAVPPPGVTATVIAGDFNADAYDLQVRATIDAGYQDVARAAGTAGPTVTWQPWLRPDESAGPDDGLCARIDYQFLKATAGAGPSLVVRGCRRIFNRNVLAGIYQPRVSDHVGLLGVYGPPG